MQITVKDIRPIKSALRAEAKKFRASMSDEEKERIDRKIVNKVSSLWSFREADMILTYVSTPIEVDTRELISYAWKLGKKVAVPRCIPATRDMKFYYITSFEQLEPGTFGVWEPIPALCDEVTHTDNSLCIVPALLFDKDGHRLGYGKGYYDRFLSGYSGKTVGLCYAACRRESIPSGKFDKTIHTFISEKQIYSIEE